MVIFMVTFRRSSQGLGLAKERWDFITVCQLQFAISKNYRYYVGVLMVPEGKVEIPAFGAGSGKRQRLFHRFLDPITCRLDYALPCNP